MNIKAITPACVISCFVIALLIRAAIQGHVGAEAKLEGNMETPLRRQNLQEPGSVRRKLSLTTHLTTTKRKLTNERREKMKKAIKAMVSEKLKQKGWGVSDENVREIIKKFLYKICELLPQGKSEISEEFSKVMFNSTETGKEVEVLVEKAMNERDDLLGYLCIRQELENAINKWR